MNVLCTICKQRLQLVKRCNNAYYLLRLLVIEHFDQYM